MLFTIMLATLLSTDWFGYLWGGSGIWPSWMPRTVSSENTPGSSDYGPTSHRLTPIHAASFYATLDGNEVRTQCFYTNETASASSRHEITSRRLINYEAFDAACRKTLLGYGPIGGNWRWSSSAFDFNYRGYPTYARLACGSFSDFGWTRFPLTDSIKFTALAGFGDLQGLNEKGILPYSTSVFYPAAHEDATQIREIFEWLNAGEEYADERNTPDMCENARTNWQKWAKYDLSMDEMMKVHYGTDPRGINRETHRIDDLYTNRISVCNQAMGLYDRMYALYDPMVTLFQWESWDYGGSIKSAEDEELEIQVVGGVPTMPAGTYTPAIEAGEDTHTVMVTTNSHQFTSPRFRATSVTKRFNLSADSGVVKTVRSNLQLWADPYLSEWFGGGDGYIDEAFAMDDAGMGTFAMKPSTNDTWVSTTVEFGDATLDDGSYTMHVSGSCGASYGVSRTLRGTNDIDVCQFPNPYMNQFCNGSKKARMFEMMFDTDQKCPAITSVISWRHGDEDFGNVRYRAKTQSYTTTNTLASVMVRDDEELLALAKSAAAAWTGSANFYDYSRYAALTASDFTKGKNLVNGLNLRIEWIASAYTNCNVLVECDPQLGYTNIVAVANVHIAGEPTYTTNNQWTTRPQAAVDTKRRIVGEANFKFPVERSKDGTIITSGGTSTMKFYSPIVSEEEHKDEYTGTTVDVVDGDDPVYHVCKSGFEGAWSNSQNLVEARFSYLTNAEERAFAYAFKECPAFAKLTMPSLEYAGTNAFLEAFYDDSSLTNVDLRSLKTADKRAFYQAFLAAKPSDVALTNLENAAEESFYRAFFCASANNNLKEVSLPALTNAGYRSFCEAWSGTTTGYGGVAITNIDLRSIRVAGEDSFNRAFWGADWQSIWENGGLKIDMPMLETAGNGAFRDAFDYATMSTLTSISLPKLTNCHAYAFYMPLYRNSWDNYTTVLGWLDMRSLKYLDCWEMDFCNNAAGSATRIVARFDSLEIASGYRTRWPTTFSTADEIYFTKTDPMDGEDVFYSDEYTLPWDCVVHVPTNKVGVWKNSSYWSDYAWQIAGGEDDYMVCKPYSNTLGDTFVVTCRCSEVGLTTAKFGSNLASTSVSGATEYEDGYYRVSYSGKPKGEEFNPYFVNADGEEVYGHTTYPTLIDIDDAYCRVDTTCPSQQVNFTLHKYNIADTNYYATLCDSSYNPVGGWAQADAWELGYDNTTTGMVALGSSTYNLTNYPYLKMRCGNYYATKQIKYSTEILTILNADLDINHSYSSGKHNYSWNRFVLSQQKLGDWPGSISSVKLIATVLRNNHTIQITYPIPFRWVSWDISTFNLFNEELYYRAIYSTTEADDYPVKVRTYWVVELEDGTVLKSNTLEKDVDAD